MTWTNKATTRGLRLCKQENNIHYEISKHVTYGGLSLEVENVKLSKLIEHNKYTVEELLKKFPDLKEWESLLFAYEQIAKDAHEEMNLRHKIALLKNNARKEHQKLYEGFNKHFWEGYMAALDEVLR